jgi:hypothetical protein
MDLLVLTWRPSADAGCHFPVMAFSTQHALDGEPGGVEGDGPSLALAALFRQGLLPSTRGADAARWERISSHSYRIGTSLSILP